MLLHMYEQNIAIYTILFLFGLGIISRLFLAGAYRQLVKASRDMGMSENKLMKLIRLRFDTCYKIKLGVHNVDSFVDKYVYSHKFCGISLYTWENISGQLNILCFLFTIVALGGAFILKCGQDILLSTFITGMTAVIVLIAFEKLLGITAKQNLLHIHMKDYLENNLKAKLENEYFLSEEIEEYHNSYFDKAEEPVKEARQRVRRSVDQKVERTAEREAEKAVEKTADKAPERVAERPSGKPPVNAEDEKIIEDILKEYLV